MLKKIATTAKTYTFPREDESPKIPITLCKYQSNELSLFFINIRMAFVSRGGRGGGITNNSSRRSAEASQMRQLLSFNTNLSVERAE